MAENISEENLIILVQEHECLYNLAHKDYDNNLVKDNVWKEIAASLCTTVDVCKNKWTLLRGYYRRALQRRKTKSGQAAKNIKKWRFESQMDFLKPHLQERGTYSNLDYARNSLEDDDTENDREELQPSDSEPVTQIDDADSVSSMSFPATSLETRPPSSKESTPSRTKVETQRSKQRKCEGSETEKLTDALSNYIKFKQSVSSQKETKHESSLSAKKRNLLNFFDDIAETMLTFSDLEQAEIKRDIFNLVKNKQIDNLRRTREPLLSGATSTYYGQQLHPYTSFGASTSQVQHIYQEDLQGSGSSYQS